MHEADQPNAVVDLLDAELLSSQHGGEVDPFAMQIGRLQAVTSTSRSWNGCR
jgi:hypothetical protein